MKCEWKCLWVRKHQLPELKGSLVLIAKNPVSRHQTDSYIVSGKPKRTVLWLNHHKWLVKGQICPLTSAGQHVAAYHICHYSPITQKVTENKELIKNSSCNWNTANRFPKLSCYCKKSFLSTVLVTDFCPTNSKTCKSLNDSACCLPQCLKQCEYRRSNGNSGSSISQAFWRMF